MTNWYWLVTCRMTVVRTECDGTSIDKDEEGEWIRLVRSTDAYHVVVRD